MAGTFEGLGVPAYGGYTCYNGTAPTTSYLTVNTIGTHDFVWADIGADNHLSVTLTNSAAAATGYIQAYYASITQTGALTGDSELSGFATDMSIGANVNIAQGFTCYISGANTGSTVYGARLCLAPTTTFTSNIGLSIEKYNPTIGTGNDWFIRLFNGGSGVTRDAIALTGTAMPLNFVMIQTDATNGCFDLTAITSMTGVASLRCRAGDTSYRIPLIADSCTD